MAESLRLIEVAHASHTGRVRNHNEDRALVQPPLLAVADGVGGANAGEVAAQIAIDAVAGLAKPTAKALRDRIVEANTQIRNVADENLTHVGMGTTMTAALLSDGGATIMHVGDSRAYLMRDGELRQLTDDHSLIGEMLRQGQISQEDAALHPSRNVITRALGAEPGVLVDEVHTDLRAGDRLVLCSDGLSSMVRDDDIRKVLADTNDLQEATRALMDAALDAGGLDNVTIVASLFDTTPVDGTGALPVIGPQIGADETAPITIPPPPDSVPKASRAPEVLEPTRPSRSSILRRIVGLGTVVVLLGSAFAAWVGSRTYFVDGEDGDTVRVYHGAPVEIAGISLFAQWGDTGVDAQTVRTAAPGLLSRAARGQGEAVRRAVDIVWAHGLPTVPAITPPEPEPRPAPRRAPTSTP